MKIITMGQVMVRVILRFMWGRIMLIHHNLREREREWIVSACVCVFGVCVCVCLFYPQVYSAPIQDHNLTTYYLIYKINTQHLITTSSIYPCAPIFTVFFSLLSRSWTNYWFLQYTATKSLSYQSHPIYWYSRSKANSFSAWLYPLVACFVVQKRTKF